MNAHFIDAADVLDVFADAQRLGIRYRSPSRHLGFGVRMTRAEWTHPKPSPASLSSVSAPLPVLRRFPTRKTPPTGLALRTLIAIGRTKPIAPLQTSRATCIRCGGVLEWREGLKRPVHLGRCASDLAQAAE